MTELFATGKNGELCKIDFSKLKSGITKEELGIEKGSILESIFDSINNNKEGDSANKLDRNELNEFLKQILDLAGKNKKLSMREAKHFELDEDNKLGKKNKAELFNFLKKLSSLTDGIESIKENKTNNSEVITYETDENCTSKTEEIFKDGSKIFTIKNQNKTVVSKEDKNGNITQEVTTEDDNEFVVDYENNVPIKGVKTTAEEIETFDYKNNSKTVLNKNNNILEKYVQENGKYLLKQTQNLDTNETTIYNNGKEINTKYENEEIIETTTNNGIIERKKITKKNKNNQTEVSTTTYQGENTTTEVVVDGNTRTQKKVIDNNEYSLEYDEEGNALGIIVQNGESIQAIAKKFGCSVKELIEVNGKKVKGKYPHSYFLVGDEIKIPPINGELLQADSPALQGRLSKEETISQYEQLIAEQRERQREQQEKSTTRVDQGNADLETHSNGRNIKWKEQNFNTFEDIAEQLFKNEGITNPKKEDIKKRAEELRKTNPNLKDGNLKGNIITARVSEKTFERVTKRAADRKINDKIKKNQQEIANSEKLAKEFYQIADDNSSLASIRKMQKFLDSKINDKNILHFITSYNNEKIRKGDSSIIDTITSEIMPSGDRSEQIKVLETLFSKLESAAKNAGVPQENIKKAKKDFQSAINKEYKSFSGAFRRTNPLEMETAINYLCGEILTKQRHTESNLSEKEAIDQFRLSYTTTHVQASEDFYKAREEEGFFAGVGDSVLGLFGCNTIKDLRNKLGDNVEKVVRLNNAKNEQEFKILYKEAFGIEFDKKKIDAYNDATVQYETATLLDYSIKLINDVIKQAHNLNTTELKNLLKTKLQWNDNIINSLLEGVNNDRDAKAKLLEQLDASLKQMTAQYKKTTQGKSLDMLSEEISQLKQSAFGTNDIAKEVEQFNKNMVITEMATVGTVEVIGTIALQFVPGVGQIAGVALAAKFAKIATKAPKVIQAVNMMTNAGIATATVGMINGDDPKDIMKRTLMNMSFAGVGSGSSILAPKLVKAFGISSTLAKEIAEEIINAAGSYGIVKYTGGEYGKEDAFIDMAVGLIIARCSHLKGNSQAASKNNINGASTNTNTPTLTKATSQGTAHPADVKVGSKKVKAIETEVDNVIANKNTTGEQLAQTRSEVEAISNRDVRRTEQAKIDERANDLSVKERAAFDSNVKAKLEKEVKHVFEKHSELDATDVRIINEYIKGTDDVSSLNKLADELRNKELTHGGATRNYEILYSSINKRINTLTPKPKLSNEKVKNYVYSKLNSDKGLVKEEVEQILDYIKNISTEEELKELTTLINKKKMIGAHKKQLQNALNEQSNKINTPIDNQNTNTSTEVNEVPQTVNTHNSTDVSNTSNLRNPKTHDFSETEIKTFENIKAKNIKELEEQLKTYGFEREMLGYNGVIPSNGQILFSFINKENGVRYVFSLENNSLLPFRMISTDPNIHTNYSSVEFRRDENGNIVETIQKASDGTSQSIVSQKDPEVAVVEEHIKSDPAVKTENDLNQEGYNTTKNIESMTQDELFEEYNKLKMEVTNSSLNTTDKAGNIKKMKEIEKLLEQKGYSIEGNQLVKNNEQVINSESVSSNNVESPKSKYSITELRQKLGEAKFKIYQNTEKLIEELKTIFDYNKIKNSIHANFHEFKDIMEELLNKLEIAAQKAKLNIKKKLFAETGSKYFQKTDVSDFVNTPVGNDPQALYQNLLNKGFQSTSATAFNGNQAFLSLYDPQTKALYTYVFEGSTCKHKSKCFVTKNADGSYIRHSDLSVDYQNDGSAKIKIAEDNKDVYSKEIRPESTSQTRTKGSNKSRKAAYAKFNPKAKLITYKDYSGSKVLDRNAQYSIDYNKPPKLTFVDGTSIDLNTPDIKDKIRNLQPGEYITIGREGDILIPNASEQISPHHILIVKTNSGVAIKDVSDIGGTVAHTYEYGFKPQTEGKTVVDNLKPEEVLVTQVNHGYNIHTQNNTILAFDTRVMGAKISQSPNGYVIYNPDYNVTSITIDAIDHVRRPGAISIFIKGNISKNDMENFIKYLKENNIITQDNINGKTFVNGAEIQKEAIKYFSTFN